MENNWPLISVIVPVYNVEPYLRKCIDSLLKQSYPNMEIVLVDDCSTDASGTICDDYCKDNCNILVTHKKNGGLSSARNAGLDIAKGQYIGFVDSDDFVSPNMYMALFHQIKGKDNAFACCSLTYVDEAGNYLGGVQAENNREQTISDYLRSLLLYKGDCSVCTKLFCRSLFEQNRFDEGKLNEDVLLAFRIGENVKSVVYTEEKGYFYLTRQGSITRSFGKAIHDMVTNAYKIEETVKKSFPELCPYAERFVIYQNLAFLRHCPVGYVRKDDAMCGQAHRYLKAHYFCAIKNPYFRLLDKIILSVACISPRLLSLILSIRAKKNTKK